MGCGIGNKFIHSFVIGKVKTFNDVEAIISDEKINFTIIEVETAVGILPVAVNKDNFNIENIEKNMILVMSANIKAEF